MRVSRSQTATKGDIKRSILFDAGPEEDAWERNANRLKPALCSVDLIQLSHWHRDHSGLSVRRCFSTRSLLPGGLLRAIRSVNCAKHAKGVSRDTVVDVHPERPDYRGFALGEKIISLKADPSFEEIEAAGATVTKHDETHTVLDNLFLISGEIPRLTPYETGLKGAMRYDRDEKDWFSDESITDERFLMCNLKGLHLRVSSSHANPVSGKGIVMFTACSHAGVVNAARHAVNLLGDVPLHGVVGGFHLATSEHDQMESTIKDLKRLDPAVLLPGHCTGWRAKFAIEKHMPGALVPCTVGIKITF